ncbi:electron transport complex subunit RsxC [Natranaerobius trueperi]|uniref:Ion-translocating oxidoreductase complex subunit C n=1 Tax=Natranaerobius trueperi TaxID=759412 RepID=A0A226C0J6_9FIRM|nr:electron transport complex subunit RsxC [Natranaerobius trueperi]
MAGETFRGGVEPGHFKYTTEDAVEKMAAPSKVYIPMEQHIGAPCEPVVSKGDKVKLGQKIGGSDSFVSAPIHSSVSGEVVDITEYNHPIGKKAKTIVIESDGQDEADYSGGYDSLDELSSDDIKKIVKEAGIVGMGGATFPTHVKLSPPEDKPIDTVIINGAECEPYLTSDHRMMLEQGEEIVFGLKSIMKAVNCDKGVIGIEDNKKDAIENMKELVKDENNIEVMVFETKYPQGAEKQLITVATGREVPSGGLPMDVGCVVNNVGTAIAISEAIRYNKPSYERVVTVTGPGVNEAGNFKIRVGTLASEVIENCAGMSQNTRKIVMGGPMMGLSQPSPEFPVIKGTSGLLLLTENEVQFFEEKPCISCGRCIDSCPVSLLPNMIAHFTENERLEQAEEYNALDCIECGCCTYICPTKRPLVQYIRMAKGEIMAKRRKN